MNSLIYDIVIAAVLLLTVYLGWRKGLILSVAGLLSVFVALLGAAWFSNLLTVPVSHLILPGVEKAIRGYVEIAASSASKELGALGGGELLEYLRESPVLRGFAEAVKEALGTDAVQSVNELIAAAAEYVAMKLVHAVLFVLIFVVVLILWSVLAHTLDFASRLPVLNTMNRLGGAVFGLLKGGLLVFIVVWLLGDRLASPEVMEKTKLLRFFATVNPVELIGRLGRPDELKLPNGIRIF